MSVSTKRTHQEFKTDKILDKRTPLTSTNGSKCCQSTFQGGFSAPVSSSVRRRTMGQTAPKRPETSFLECIPPDIEFNGFNTSIWVPLSPLGPQKSS